MAPAGVSELFGLKCFCALDNFLTLANSMASLVFSGVIASSLYDREAERQAHQHSLMFSFAVEPLTCNVAICCFSSSLIMFGFCICAVSCFKHDSGVSNEGGVRQTLWKISTAGFG